MSSVTGRMIRGSLWISGGRAVVNALSFIGTVVLARLLVPGDFGLVALGMTVVAIAGALTSLSLSEALVQHREPTVEHFHTAFTLNLARALLLAIAISAVAVPFAAFYHEPRLRELLYALSVSVAVGGLSNPRTIMLSRQLVFWQDFLFAVSNKLFMTAAAVIAALLWRSYWALVIGAIAGQIVSVILSYVVISYRPRIAWKHAAELWSFSVWLTLSQGMNTVNWRFDQLLVGGFLGRSALGFYSVGDNLAQTMTREATSPLTATLFPAFARIADDPGRLRGAYQRAQRLVTAIALPIGVGFAFVARPFVIATMGEKWIAVVPVIQALSSVFALQTLGTLVQPLGLAQGETKLLFRRDVQLFLFRLPVITAGMLLGGLIGLIYSRVFTGLIGTGINMLLVQRMVGLPVRRQLTSNARSLMAVAIMSAGLLAMSLLMPRAHEDLPAILLEMTIVVAAGAALYLGSTAALWLAAGCPGGPEREVWDFLSLLGARIRHQGSRRS